MQFPSPLVPGRLLRRYKRFLADVELSDGQVVTAHCPNPGSMLTCASPGSKVMLSRSENPERKLRFTWELVRVPRTWVGVNTGIANRVVEEALRAGRVPELAGFDALRREVRYGERSRVDFMLECGRGRCYVEVKSVTLAENGHALFPDSVTERGARHLRELVRQVEAGHRGVMLYLVNRQDCESMGPAASIDPVYAATLQHALGEGVEALVYCSQVSPKGICLYRRIPFRLNSR